MKRSLHTLAFSLLPLLAGCDALFLAQPAADPEAVFEDLWNAFNEQAANLDERKVDWQALYANYRPYVTPATTDDQLFSVLTGMLAHLEDSHVSLTAPGQPYFNANRIYRERIGKDLFDLDVIRERYLGPGANRGHSFLCGKIAERNIGSVHFGTIAAGTMAKLPEMLDAYPDASGYIIDLRQNAGGNHTFAFDAMGRFADRSRYVFKSKTKNGPRRDEYTPWHAWHLKPSGRYIDRPVAVLTDRYTPNAAERMVMAFRTLPNATIVGDTTSGTHGTKIPRELANGWYYTLSVQKVEMFDGRSYEGIGLAPDVVIRNDAGEVRAAKDRTLEAAIQLIE